MIVKVDAYQDTLDDLVDTTYGEFDMLPHPYLDCAYYYGGFDKALNELCTSGLIEIPGANAIDDLDNKLLISEINDPFSFPLEHRYTFQSKVLGVASTALSQGQFGQLSTLCVHRGRHLGDGDSGGRIFCHIETTLS